MTKPETTHTDAGSLSYLMDFDHIIRVVNGEVVTPSDGPWAPSAYLDGDEFILTDSNGRWEALTGYTGQHGYRGPIMHSSELIMGRLAEDILATDGDYVALVVTVLPEDADDEASAEYDVAGWCVARLIRED